MDFSEGRRTILRGRTGMKGLSEGLGMVFVLFILIAVLVPFLLLLGSMPSQANVDQQVASPFLQQNKEQLAEFNGTVGFYYDEDNGLGLIVFYGYSPYFSWGNVSYFITYPSLSITWLQNKTVIVEEGGSRYQGVLVYGKGDELALSTYQGNIIYATPKTIEVSGSTVILPTSSTNSTNSDPTIVKTGVLYYETDESGHYQYERGEFYYNLFYQVNSPVAYINISLEVGYQIKWVVCGGVSLTSPKIQTGELYINATHVEYGIYQGGWHEETGFYGPLNISLEGNYTYSNSHNNEGYFSVIDYIVIINVVYENGKSVTIMSIGPIEHESFPQISINIDHGSSGYYNQLTWIATVEGTEKISVEPTLIDDKV
ncbi:hypothetical protein [Candidatus Acidianus copahuensis]|nr:hypothetical protein [Candidatus Acidianus copahuensis]